MLEVGIHAVKVNEYIEGVSIARSMQSNAVLLLIR